MEHNYNYFLLDSRTSPSDTSLYYEPGILSGNLAADKSLVCQSFSLKCSLSRLQDQKLCVQRVFGCTLWTFHYCFYQPWQEKIWLEMGLGPGGGKVRFSCLFSSVSSPTLPHWANSIVGPQGCLAQTCHKESNFGAHISPLLEYCAPPGRSRREPAPMEEGFHQSLV